MAKLPGAYEILATAGAPAINFARGLLGYQDPFLTQTMRDRMKEIEGGRTRGNVGYEDYGLDSSAGRFTGGLMNLAINNPVDFGLAGSIGKYDFGPEGRKGLTYDFTPDRDTGSTGNAILDFINRGGLKGAFSRMGTAEASDLGAIASNEMLQSILNPKTPKLATTFLESMNRGPIVDDDPYPPEFFPNDQQDSLEVDMGATGTIPTLNNTGIMSAVNNFPYGALGSEDNYQGFTDKEDFSTIKPSGLQTLLSFLPFGSNSVLGQIGQGIRNALQGSRFYRPATIGVGGYTPAQLNQMNALGGFYSEPMRQFRRRSNRISNMLQRAAEGKNYSEKNLRRLMKQFDMGDTDTRGMIDSIKASADMGYGRGGGRDFDSGRDYSSSPGAIAGDMEYGEE
tara:strand:+ start:63 stop:1250 length:1188 start_codon:yes stop_codon:yes gene_type:complete